MKKAKLFMLGLTSLALASCSLFGGKDKDGEDEKTYDYEPANGIVGGTEAEQEAIMVALNNRPMANLNGKTSTEMFPYPDSYMTLKEDDGDGIKLTKSQVIGDLTVKITWSVPEQEYLGGVKESDAAHDIVEIGYKGYEYGKEHGLGEFNWSIKKMECGSAVADNANIPFKAKVQNEQYFHTDCHIEDLYAFKDEQKTVAGHKFDGLFDLVDYDEKEGETTYSPYFMTNNPDATEKQYWYVNVPGKVIYLAPDGDWGLIADGDHVLEIFAGSGTAFTTTNWPNLAVGKYVNVSGNLGQYQGNVQLGFVTKIKEAKASDLKAEPTGTFRELTEEKLALLDSSFIECQKQAVAIDEVPVVGSLRQVTGSLVTGSIAIKEGDNFVSGKDVSALKKEVRFMFKLKVGTAGEISVAYDYHVEAGATAAGIFSKLQAKLSNPSAEFTVKGTMRYFGNNSDPFITEGNPGVWSLCPFDAGHII